MINELLAIALTTGVLSALWSGIAVMLGLLSWAGFLGCTAYFACPIPGKRGLVVTLLTLGSGVLWAQVVVTLSALATHWLLLGYIISGLVAFCMCIQAKQGFLSFIPGTFIGACATFASNDHWQVLVPSLLVGTLFGYMMKNSGLWLTKRLQTSSVEQATTSESRLPKNKLP